MLTIPKVLLDQVHAHVTAAYPNEACGLLLGDLQQTVGGSTMHVVVRIEATANVADQLSAFESHVPGSLSNRYLISPDDYVRIDRAAHAENLDIIGIFHSHPDHPATPSREDLRTAWLGLSYVIVSVQRGAAADTTSWRLMATGTAFESESIRLIE